MRLDEYIRLLIQADGMDVVANQYNDLREEYYQKYGSLHTHSEGIVKGNKYVYCTRESDSPF
jgi:hypothetical protein